MKRVLELNIVNATAFIGSIVALLVALNNRNKAKSEAESAATIAYTEIVEPLRQRISDLEARVSSLELENKELRRGVRILSNQLREAGHEPAWEPRDA